MSHGAALQALGTVGCPESVGALVMAEMWTSKLGGRYAKAEIDASDRHHHDVLQAQRRRPENALCADCRTRGTVWAIVNHGVFVCMRCAALHRSLGTHVSKPKGCTGTYLWGPDEVAAMARGNDAANEALGGAAIPTPAPTCSDADLRAFLVDKYEQRRWAPRGGPPAAAAAADLLGSYDATPVRVAAAAPPVAAGGEPDFFASFGL